MLAHPSGAGDSSKSAFSQHIKFLFSDANLCRDKYLAELLSGVGVPIERLFRFHKVREIIGAKSSEAVRRAVQELPDLTLAFDDAAGGWCVQRRRRYVHVEGKFDESTVFVGGLPQDATIDSLTQTFRRFGTILRVDLPRMKAPASGSAVAASKPPHKGIAFVVFSQLSEMHAAVAAYAGHPRHDPRTGKPHERLQVAPKLEWMSAKQHKAAAAGPGIRSEHATTAGAGHAPDAFISDLSLAGVATTSSARTSTDSVSSSSSERAADGLHPGTLVRLAGIKPDTPFSMLRAAARVPGRVMYVDCPALWRNRIVDVSSDRFRSQRAGAAKASRSSGVYGDTPALSHSSVEEDMRALFDSHETDEVDEVQGAGVAADIVATIRYATAQEAHAAVAWINGGWMRAAIMPGPLSATRSSAAQSEACSARVLSDMADCLPSAGQTLPGYPLQGAQLVAMPIPAGSDEEQRYNERMQACRLQKTSHAANTIRTSTKRTRAEVPSSAVGTYASIQAQAHARLGHGLGGTSSSVSQEEQGPGLETEPEQRPSKRRKLE